MKQTPGYSTTLGGVKTEPQPNAVSVRAVSEIGVHQVPSSQVLYQGRGLEAPMVGSTTHEHGSQGKHK